MFHYKNNDGTPIAVSIELDEQQKESMQVVEIIQEEFETIIAELTEKARLEPQEVTTQSMQEEIDKKVTELKYKAIKGNLTTTEKILLAQLTG